jgi:NAD(P)H-hydrate epimerase
MLKPTYLKETLKQRDPSAHKGQNGRVLIVGGSRRYFGSPALIALAALRTGADLAYVLAPDYIANTIASYSPDLIVWGYEGERLSEDALSLFYELKARTDAMVIGNGLTKQPAVLEMARELIEKWDKPVVIDADCIQPNFKFNPQTLITPHLVEFQRLTGKKPPQNEKERATLVKKEAKNLNCTILLKGGLDIISDGGGIATNNIHNAGMTHGGTGDTLAGIAGALLSQKYPIFEAGCMAALINGMAGNLAFKKYRYSLIASDIITEIPNIMKKYQK